MVSTRQILLVSPREPSGATWLINCFLELGIRTYRDSRAEMWREKGAEWVLSPHESILKKWLPALTRIPSFAFRENLEVRWTHEWPGAVTRGQEVVLFVRDPRDALYSRFRREASDLTFAEFLWFLDPRSLLDKIDNWILFLRSWLVCERVHLVRFEDYKSDATTTLETLLKSLGVDVSEAAMKQAVAESTFEKAAAAETQYRLDHPDDEELINRKGMPREWSAIPDLKVEMERVSRRCGHLLEELGYAPLGEKVGEPDFTPHARLVRTLATVSQFAFPKRVHMSDAIVPGPIGRVCEFAIAVTPDLLDRAGLKPYEREQLVQELERYVQQVYVTAQHKRNEIQPWPQMIAKQVKQTVAQFLSLKRNRLH